MGKGFRLLICGLILSGAQAYADTPSFYRMAMLTVDSVNQAVTECGLQIVDPRTPGLPRPQVSAISAIVNQSGYVLAYYDEESNGDNTFVFKNPNGSFRHSISFDENRLKVITPMNGVVARVKRFHTPQGFFYHYYCGQVMVNEVDFGPCVQRSFVNWIAQQLCRSAP